MSDVEAVRVFLEALGGEGGTALFHDPFLSLDPSAAVVVGRQQLAAALPARGRMFAQAGVTGLELRDVDVRRLDARHLLAETTWESAPGSSRPVSLSSTYLLRQTGERLEAVVYLNHQDVGAVLGGAEHPAAC